MKLRFKIDQADHFRRGVDAPQSVMTIDVNPADLPQDKRDLIARYLLGIDVVKNPNTISIGKDELVMAKEATAESLCESLSALKASDEDMDRHAKEWHDREPWVAVDPSFKREWVFAEPLRYYVVADEESREWFVCDRWTDLAVRETRSKTRTDAIRRFYKWCKREIPTGITLDSPLKGTAHRGETG